MRTMIRAAIALVGLFNLAIGLAFLAAPARLGARFFLLPASIQGLATMRADFTAFFVTGGTFALLGAWRGRPEPLSVPLLLLAIALFGRCVAIAIDGASPTAFEPMIAEAAMIAILLAGRRILSNRR
ncbi:hypothetical protein NDN01_22465 [Sphingomonas sp. QA11]|uniref:hypothetical protein n=1 Tax=Sphingomonas sp. QA11 TaxID=2950605 RepID=UPI00234A25C3|nr:hypothetical protein [Sphingomonas sp. QA11]WCM26730.1 hypothetical protein NDN01_22465 [Sphingomonas sp. QA11]